MKLFIGIVLLFFLSFAAADEFDEFGGVSIWLGYFNIKLFYVNIFSKDDDEFDVPKNEFDDEDVEIESVDDFEEVGTNQEGITLGDTLMDPVDDEFDDEEFENMPGNIYYKVACVQLERSKSWELPR